MRILAPEGVQLYLKSFFTTPFSVHKKKNTDPPHQRDISVQPYVFRAYEKGKLCLSVFLV